MKLNESSKPVTFGRKRTEIRISPELLECFVSIETIQGI